MDEVSAREAEVWAEVALGRTNQQIARSLHLSVRTVESHVSSLLRKLDVADRWALAAIASSPLPHRAPEADAVPIVGRDADLAELDALLARPGLVTLVASGGAGKTTLARVVAARRRSVFVELCGLPVGAGHDLVAGAVAAAIGVTDVSGQRLTDVMTTHLATVPTLVVLDNCEHVLEAAAQVAVHLRRLPTATVLATSRERLAVPGERVHRLEPLSLDDAVALFRDRALAADPAAILDEATVAALCERLDRLPLALELAAARLAVFDLADLTERLEGSFELLEGGDRTNQRHRSVHDAIEWSHDLLSPADRIVYRRISVFPVAASLDAIEAVVGGPSEGFVGDPAAAVARLCEASLLVRDGRRFRQLDLVQAHAARRLAIDDRPDAVTARLIAWARAVFEAGRFEPEIVASFEPALASGTADGAALALAVAERLAAVGRISEAIAFFERLAIHGGDAALALRAAEIAFGWWRGDEGVRLVDLSLGLARAADDPFAEVRALTTWLEVMVRYGGMVSARPTDGELREVLARAEDVAGRCGDEIETAARLLIARAWVEHIAVDERVVEELAGRGLSAELCAALYDAALARPLHVGDLTEVHRLALARVPLLPALQGAGRAQLERGDLIAMVSDTSVAVGAPGDALHWAERMRAETERPDQVWAVGGRQMVALHALGRFDEVVALADDVRAGWERAGRPAAAYLGSGLAALVSALRLRGDDDGAGQWEEFRHRVLAESASRSAAKFVYDAMTALHFGRLDEARAALIMPVDEVYTFWRPWYAAMLVEATDPRDRQWDGVIAGSRYATGVVLRARGELEQAIDVFDSIGARYEAARTRMVAGGSAAVEGRVVYAELGLEAP